MIIIRLIKNNVLEYTLDALIQKCKFTHLDGGMYSVYGDNIGG